MAEPLGVLTAELQRTANRHREWKSAKRLADDVRELDEEIRNTDWPSRDEQRHSTADGFLTRLTKVQNEALKVAAALERPRRYGKSMRRST